MENRIAFFLWFTWAYWLARQYGLLVPMLWLANIYCVSTDHRLACLPRVSDFSRLAKSLWVTSVHWLAKVIWFTVLTWLAYHGRVSRD